MRNTYGALANAMMAWAQHASSAAITRTSSALDQMRAGSYSTEELMQDVYEYWRDLGAFRAPAALGMIPAASLNISAWAGNEFSNFVLAPVVADAAHLQLTTVANPETNTVLGGLELDFSPGDNSVRVQWVSANAGGAPAGADENGLFQGGIFYTVTNELVATVFARTHLP